MDEARDTLVAWIVVEPAALFPSVCDHLDELGKFRQRGANMRSVFKLLRLKDTATELVRTKNVDPRQEQYV